MRFLTEKKSQTEREAVRARMQALLDPEAALDVLRRLGADGRAVRARCSAVRGAKDRYVIRVETEAADGGREDYALKGYADARGEDMALVYEGLGRCWARPDACPVVQPLGYLADKQLFLLPWIQGSSLAEAIAAGDRGRVVDAIGQVPQTLARLHATPLVPEAPTHAEAMLELAAARWNGHYTRRRGQARRAVIDPLMARLRSALPRLAPMRPKLVHGDTGPGNFLWDGARWRLLDLDTYGYADPAYDVGYLVAKMENQCLAQPLLRPQAAALAAAMREACLRAMPEVAEANVAFFYAITLTRKTLAQQMRALPRDRLGDFSAIAAPIVKRIHDALEATGLQ